MINKISERAIRRAFKIEPSNAVHDKQVAHRKSGDLREARPVDDSEARDEPGSKEADNEGSSRYQLDENTVTFEKYNKDGYLIYQAPPSCKPVDERV